MYDLLKGLRVVEGSAFVAAPTCGLYLAQMGAEVIRFDTIGGGPDFRRWPLSAQGDSLYWEGLNKGKKSIAIDLGRPEGRELAQRLAEDSKFPDGYFDLVTSYIAHHEMPADVTRKVIAEVRRITRPGGVYYPVDFISGGVKAPPQSLYARWWDHRWNNEVWSMEYHSIDFTSEIGQRGFAIVKDAKPALRGFGVRHAIREA